MKIRGSKNPNPWHSIKLYKRNLNTSGRKNDAPILVVVFTHSLDPCLWGESDHPAFGLPASISLHLASNSVTPAGPVHKSRGDSVVQLKRWCVLQRGGVVVMGVIGRRLCVSMN